MDISAAELSADPSRVARSFNLFTPGLDPHELFAALRERCPAAWSDEIGGHWLVTRSDDISMVLRDYETFSNVYDFPPGHGAHDPRVPVNYDPPEQTAYRQVFAPWFSPTVVESIEDATRQQAVELLDGLVGRDSCEFVTEFAQPFASLVFIPFLGLSADELDELLVLHHDLVVRLHSPSADNEGEQTVRRAEERLRVKINDALDLRAAMEQPPDDIFSRMLQARLPDGRPFSREELFSAVTFFFAAGLGTIKHTLSLAIWFLGTHPEYRDQLVEDPSLIPGAVEEFLRYFATVTDIRRTTRDIELHDVALQEGTMVLCPLASAGRDPEAHDDPERIDFRRSPNRHIGFGVGPHRCLGSHLARMELRVALEEIHRRMPAYTVDASAQPEWTWGLLFGIGSLPMTIATPQPSPPRAQAAGDL